MTIDSCFETAKEHRDSFIEKSIICKLPVKLQADAKKRSIEIVTDYAGRDLDALSVLAYAAEAGRFYEFTARLKKHYKENLYSIHPEARGNQRVPGAVRAEAFFLSCYSDLGVQPQKVA